MTHEGTLTPSAATELISLEMAQSKPVPRDASRQDDPIGVALDRIVWLRYTGPISRT